METLLEAARRLASSPVPLLIQGPSGSGKKLLAHTLHELSPWRGSRPVLIHCGAMERSSLPVRHLLGDAEALEQHPGVIPEDGLVILDAVDELRGSDQKSLLGFIERLEQEGEEARCNGRRATRLIAVTSRDLASDVDGGRFRADLHRAIAATRLEVPPLEDRSEDVLLLANHFLTRFSLAHGKRGRYLTASAERALMLHPWPGNVRELESRVLEALLVSQQPAIGARELRLQATSDSPAPDQAASSHEAARDPGHEPRDLAEVLEVQVRQAVEAQPPLPLPLGRWLAQDLILEANRAARGVARRAAAGLNIPETTFRRRRRQAITEVEAGLAQRGPGWDSVRTHLARLVEAPPEPEVDLLLHCRRVLLKQVLRALPGNPSFGATLMGITEPTFRRWVAEASRSES